ncbi:MAG: right-handed parallel beta-helix repeat-containing protein, partial [Candidatus Thorarchaeota archaeon]|nr:right-handed parallel beta-helix repeat-containing protein [Candidatus Thorarchaeota archaeon]
MNKKSIILTFGLLMILSFTMPTAFVEEYNLDRNLPAQDNMFLSNEVHDNILIVNDTDFIAQAEDEVWPGEGTPSSPYYIEGYNISSDLTGIEIHNVSLYFVIQNCYIDSVSVTSNDGIYLKNVTHSEIRDTTVQDKINGISLVYSGNVLVSGFTVSYCFNGFHLFEANNSRIEYCEIFECEYGFRSFSSDNLAISNTDVHDNLYTAIDIMESDFAEITSCGSYDNGGIGIFVWSSQNITITENVAYRNGDLDTGVLLYLSDNATITGNELYDNQHVGIMLEYSNLAIIQDNHISNNSDMGIYLYDSNNCSIMNNEVWENGFWNLRSPVGGVVLDGSLHSVIQGNSIGNNSFAGIYLVETVDYGEITGNHIYNNTDHGIYGYDSNDFKVFNNDIWGNGWNSTSTYVGAISTSACQGWNISENTIWNNVHHGMYLYGNYFDIVGNRVYNNNESGITMIMSSYDSITGNIVHGQDVGISVYNQHTDVTHNIVFDNGYGIQTYSCTNVSLYYNDLAWNTVNAEEASCFGVYWHDNQSIGNWWGDYSGASSYGITNGTHIVNY